jgi:hypothetical protein
MTRRRTNGLPALLAWLAILASGFAARTGAAHTLSESHSSWQIDGTTVRLEMIVPELEAKRLSPSGKEPPPSEDLGRYLAAHMSAESGGANCPIAEGPRRLYATTGFYREELVFKCPGTNGLKLHSSAFFDRVASHTNFARIEDAQGRFFEQLFTKDHQTIDASDSGAQSTLQNAGLLKFIGMGIMHIFTGVDHMSFMLGLVLISRRIRDLLFVVTGFTIGHSLTLALAVTGILRPDAQYIDALVALTIALIGAENIGDRTHRPLPVAAGLAAVLIVMAALKFFGLAVSLPMTLLIGGGIFSACYLMLTGHMNDAGKVRLLVTLVFGLIHGFGFASNLLEMRLPSNRLAELLIGFNVGVEIGQITVVLGALLLVALFVRLRLTVPRPLVTDVGAAFLVGEGLYWFLGRTVTLG